MKLPFRSRLPSGSDSASLYVDESETLLIGAMRQTQPDRVGLTADAFRLLYEHGATLLCVAGAPFIEEDRPRSENYTSQILFEAPAEQMDRIKVSARENLAASVSAMDDRDDLLEMSIVAPDRPGIGAQIAATVAALGINTRPCAGIRFAAPGFADRFFAVNYIFALPDGISFADCHETLHELAARNSWSLDLRKWERMRKIAHDVEAALASIPVRSINTVLH